MIDEQAERVKRLNKEANAKARDLANELHFRSRVLEKNKDRIARFLVALRASGNVAKSYRFAGIAHRTLYAWRTKYPAFKEVWEQQIEDKVDRAQEVIFDLVESDEPTIALKAAEKVLKSFRPNVWGNKVKLNVAKTFKVKW